VAVSRVFVVAGEVSGDHQAAQLVRSLRRLRPGLDVRAAGGGRLAAAGADVVVDSTAWGVIGYVEAYVRVPAFAVRFLRIVRLIERHRPDLLLLVDFPGLNRELARHFSGRLPIVYFFPPQTYGRRGRSAQRMARAAVRLLAALPFEAETYRRAGADVVYVGHPAVDEAADRASAGAAFRARWDTGSGPLIGLLPGSRVQEVRALLPPMLEAAQVLASARGVTFVIPLASPHLAPHVERLIRAAGAPIRLVTGHALDVMAAADAVVVASGTAAVEAACVGAPMVVVYRVSALTAWIARRFVITPDLGREGFSIPNIVLGRPAVPELVQNGVTGPRIRSEVERLLDPAVATCIRADLAEVRRRLGPPGVTERAAAEVARALDSRARGTLP